MFDKRPQAISSASARLACLFLLHLPRIPCDLVHFLLLEWSPIRLMFTYALELYQNSTSIEVFSQTRVVFFRVRFPKQTALSRQMNWSLIQVNQQSWCECSLKCLMLPLQIRKPHRAVHPAFPLRRKRRLRGAGLRRETWRATSVKTPDSGDTSGSVWK